MAKKSESSALISRCIKDFEEDNRSHAYLVDKYDARYRAYRGVLEKRSQAAMWTNKQHPAIVLQSIETMVANLLDPSPKWRLKARPVVGTAEEVERLRAGARANELLLSYQLTCDKYAEKQRPFDLQGLILGTTGAKQRWEYRKGHRRFLESIEEPFYDDYGNQIGSIPRLRPAGKTDVLRDDPTSEVIDMRDLIIPENAVSIQKASRLTHRLWFSFEELKDLEKQGYYGTEAGGEPIDQLKESREFSSDVYRREQDLFQAKRNKDLIEVLEMWIDGGKRVVTLANRRVPLAIRDNPFWFEHLDYQYPFVVCAGMPDLFRIHGISEVELMAEMQEMLWTLMNQRLDSLQLLANAIFLIADDVEDPDAFEFAPGERWLVPRPVDQTVKAWSPDVSVPQMTISAEGLIRGDLQNVTGGMPFLSGTDSQNVDQNTATGVSIVTNLAQKRLAAKRQQFVWSKSRIGEQWCALNQQFVRTSRLVPVVGSEGAEDFEEIRPEMLQGSYSFETEMVDASFMRQERIAEASSRLQIALSAAGPFAALRQADPSLPGINLKAYVEDLLDAAEIADKERYFSYKQPDQQLAQMPQPGQAPGPGQGGGVTNSDLAAGMQSPSNGASMSPVAAMQQLQAMKGGVSNSETS